MRITNGMMINNSLRDINNNKLNVDRLTTQLSTEKVIQKPSDDPIVAIRALRFRSNLSELNQYLKRNIEDAQSWLKVTEDALVSARKMIQNMEPDLVRGATESLGTQEREAIIKDLEAFREQIFQDANADYGNRTIFTGYKTDSDMTFKTAESTTKYSITQEVDISSIDKKSVVDNKVAATATGPIAGTDLPSMHTVYRLRLAYDKLDIDLANGINTVIDIKDKDGNTVISADAVYADGGVYKDADGNEVDPYSPPAGKSYIIIDTGEIILSDAAYATYAAQTESGASLKLTYQKTGFEKNDLRPEQYFSCVKTTGASTTDIAYSGAAQDIEYTVNFNQKLKVNTEGREVYSHDIIRDIDELLENVLYVGQIETNMSNIKNKMKTAEGTELDELKSVYEALEKEYTLAEDIMQKRFEEAITEFQNHQKKFDLAITDVGNRNVRLSLNKERLTSQQTNLEELQSKNEDANLAETAILLKTAKDVYEGSLSAASNILSNNLLDFI